MLKRMLFSATSIFRLYTTDKTYVSAVFQRLHLKEDTWRIAGGTFIGFSTRSVFAELRVERRVYINSMPV
jgi:hypothetical protein